MSNQNVNKENEAKGKRFDNEHFFSFVSCLLFLISAGSLLLRHPHIIAFNVFFSFSAFHCPENQKKKFRSEKCKLSFSDLNKFHVRPAYGDDKRATMCYDNDQNFIHKLHEIHS
jgi:hypothetical protein